jgi:hypothetical protein
MNVSPDSEGLLGVVTSQSYEHLERERWDRDKKLGLAVE